MYTILRLNSDTSSMLQEESLQKAIEAYYTLVFKHDVDFFIGIFDDTELMMCNRTAIEFNEVMRNCEGKGFDLVETMREISIKTTKKTTRR